MLSDALMLSNTVTPSNALTVKYLSAVDWLVFEPVSMEVEVAVTVFWQPPIELQSCLILGLA